MTGTNVVGSFNAVNMAALMNQTQQINRTQSSDFKSFMETPKASSDNQFAKAESEGRAVSKSNGQDLKNKVNGTGNEGLKKVSETKSENENTFSEAKGIIKEVSEKICDEFGVTEEQLSQALENLGLTFLALLDADKLPEIIAEVNGFESTLSIVTDSALCEKLEAIMQFANDASERMTKLLNLTPEELNEALKTLEKMPEETTLTVTEKTPEFADALKANEKQDTNEALKNFEDKVEISATKDVTNSLNKIENNVFENEETKAEFKPIDKMNTSFEKQASDRNENPMNFAQNILQKVTEVLNETAEATAPFTTVDAADIMNQITEFIKADISSETSEISLRLHPETLGTVSVKISANNEGVLTAQFTAQNESVKAIIESQAIVLRESLETKGITVEAVEVLVQSHEFERNLSNQGRGQGEGQPSQKRGTRRINLLEDEPEVMDEEDNLVREMMAQNGSTVDFSA